MKINRLSNEDIQKRIDEILAEYPLLKRIDPTDYDPHCVICAGNEITRQHGMEIGDAWEELQDLQYLLDD